MNLIKNLSIRNKLIFIAMLPTLALLYYLSGSLKNDMKNKEVVTKVYRDVVIVEEISGIMHELQIERGHSFRITKHPDKYSRNELYNHRALVDKALLKLTQHINSEKTQINLDYLEKIATIRENINLELLDADSAYTAYSNVIGHMIESVNHISDETNDPEIKGLLGSYLFLLNAREFMGRIRSRLNENILEQGFYDNSITEFAALVGKFDINQEKFLRNSPEKIAIRFRQKLSDPMVIKTRRVIDTAYDNPSLTKFLHSAEEWWEASSGYINILSGLMGYAVLNINDTAKHKQAEINKVIRADLMTGTIILLFIVLLVYYVTTVIVTSVGNIKNAVERTAGGETNLILDVNSKDEIGILAVAFNRLISVTRDFASVTEQIGKGDYAVDVPVRGENDTLGQSLNTMRLNLNRLSKENSARTWLLTGNGELNDRIRGEKNVKELATGIISHLTPYLGAQIGAIYLAEGDRLNLVGSYAFHYRKGNTNSFKLGQGLVGQAALENKPIVFSRVPDDYVRINSGLGDTLPKNIIVYPFSYEGEVKGVIEIGSATELTQVHLQLLAEVTENIGIAFNASESRVRLKELLEETQKQAEELETQQEELRQTNEELLQKTELLERSESELKAQQEELQQTNEELEEKAGLLEVQKQSLEMAKVDVETKARELEITSKYKSEFLANMSHELRTPLNSVLILTQLLVENKSNVLTDKEVGFAKNIYSSANDLLSLINEILDLSKVEAGKIELEIAELHLNDFANNLKGMFSELAKQKAIRFDINLDRNSIKQQVLTDKLRTEQIVRNLLSNAFKFTGTRGEINVKIKTGIPPENIVNKHLKQQHEILSIEVKDSGIGISPDKQAIIFQAFQQADGSTRRKYGGTGLGLSISKELAQALGGEIHLESEEEKGSVFTLYLPLRFNESTIEHSGKTIVVNSRHEAETNRDIPDGHKIIAPGWELDDDRYNINEKDRGILILEDDYTFAGVMLNFVRERGYKGIVSCYGNSGPSLARHYNPEAIILDMKLPNMDGAEVLKQLKNDPGLRHIPVQIISGYDRQKEGLRLGAFGYALKPVKNEDLKLVFEQIEDFLKKKVKKLLIVEDNKEQNKAIKELIGNHDVSSFSVYNGKQALKLIEEEKFDCIIIDLGLPDMDGFELLESMQVLPMAKRTPVIVYTGKDLTKKEVSKLEKLADTIVLKTAESTDRLLDETTLFLHRVESGLSKEKQNMIRKLHRSDEILKNKKVLIVDDDMRNIFSLTNALEEEGLKCIVAENGIEAIQNLKKNPDTDIILMDIMMPEMDGYEATVEIRKIEKFKNLPVIALTAKAMKGDRENCLKVGMSDYIAKPVDIDRLFSLMRVWLYK